MYLTDLKNDVGELETELTSEKEKNLVLTQQLAKAKKDIANLRKTIATYRKAATDMQKDFFTGGRGGGPPSSVTMTSVAAPIGSAKPEDNQTGISVRGVDDDVMSQMSGRRDTELRESASKV